MKKQFIILFIIVLPIICLAQDSKMEPIEIAIGPQPPIDLFDQEGPFVTYPADFGDISFSFAGLLVLAPIEFTGSLLSLEPEIPARSFVSSHNSFGKLGEGLFGLPFYCLKKTFYDAPIYLWDALIEEDKTSNYSYG